MGLRGEVFFSFFKEGSFSIFLIELKIFENHLRLKMYVIDSALSPA